MQPYIVQPKRSRVTQAATSSELAFGVIFGDRGDIRPTAASVMQILINVRHTLYCMVRVAAARSALGRYRPTSVGVPRRRARGEAVGRSVLSLPTCCSSAQPESEPHASSQPDQPGRERLPVLVGRSASQLARTPLVTVSGETKKRGEISRTSRAGPWSAACCRARRG